MTSRNLLLLAGLLAASTSLIGEASSPAFFTYQNPISCGIYPTGLRDCQILRDGDWWYMTGTSFPHWSRQEVESDPSTFNNGVILYRSKDLICWEFRQFIVSRPSPDKWYYRRFWAPEIQKIGEKYYALFNCRNDAMGFVGQHTGYAVADAIEGPYTVVTEEAPLSTGNDLTFFEDDDGSVWAFWNRGREFGIGFARIDLASGTFLTEPRSAIQPGRVDFARDGDGHILQEPGYDGRLRDKVEKYHAWDSIGIEGAYVIKHAGTYYLFYSSWTRGYEIGYATADSITGPWTKAPENPFYGAQNPNACEKNGLPYTGDPDQFFNQVGHNEIFVGPDGRFWLSCHGIGESGIPLPVIDPVNFDSKGRVTAEGPTFTLQAVPIR